MQLLASLPRLPEQPQVQCTAALLISAYAPWLAQSARQGDANGLLPQLLQMLTAGLGPAYNLFIHFFFMFRLATLLARLKRMGALWYKSGLTDTALPSSWP